jgi:hypothetical protein
MDGGRKDSKLEVREEVGARRYPLENVRHLGDAKITEDEKCEYKSHSENPVRTKDLPGLGRKHPRHHNVEAND